MTGRCLRQTIAVKQARRESKGSVGSEGNDCRVYIKKENLDEDLINPPILIENIRTVKKEEEDSSVQDEDVGDGNNIISQSNESTNDTIGVPLSTDRSPSDTRLNAEALIEQTNKSQPNLSKNASKVKLSPRLILYPMTQDGSLQVEGVSGAKGKKRKFLHTENKSTDSAMPEGDPLLKQYVPKKINKRQHDRQETKEDRVNKLGRGQSSYLEKFDFTKNRAWLMPQTLEPANYFNYFIDDSYLEEISKATNKEALSKKSCRINRGFVHDWTDLTVSELKIFIGLLLHTGTAKMAHLGDYWRKHRLFKSCFRDYMTPQRFTAILRFLTVLNGSNDTDRITAHFNSVMDNIYYPGRNLNLDVYIVNWDQKAINFQPDAKNNTNSWFTTISEQDGMIVKMSIYSAPRKTVDTQTCILNLLEGKLDCGHSLNVSSLYKITPEIAKKLLQRKTYCTAVELRDVPIELRAQELKPGQNRSLFRDGVHIGKFNSGSATSYYLSTEFNDVMQKSKSSQFDEPAAITYHQEKYNAIQRTDLFEYYPCEVNKLARQKKIFVHSLLLSLLNANLLCNAFSKTSFNFYNYRLRVIEHLLPERDEVLETPNQSRSTNTEHDEDVEILQTDTLRPPEHRLSKIAKTVLRRTEDGVVRATSRRQCKNCKINKNNRVSTCYECVGCKGTPGICMDCFFEIHKITLL